MNSEQWLVALVLALPLTLGVVSAFRLSAPSAVLAAVAAGVVTFVGVVGLVYVAVEYNPPLPDDDTDVREAVGEQGDTASDEN
jgi:hypothetical protein